MRPHVQQTINELESEIRKLTEALDALRRLDGKAPGPATPAPHERKARPCEPKRASREPKPPRGEPKGRNGETGTAGADALSETQQKIVRFLDKAGPSDLKAIAAGLRTRGSGPLARSCGALVKLRLAEANDGFYKLTDKGFEAALA